ncbi:hypothetical protein Taro_023118 [Colocasia esculenta]|uniref:Uncharacterized protein n=1 Tax=Colocasia esculenta TaxID=4460 RepID=A0A843V3T4_COLES|nr:hypothetical protein [Colocasia esculenta]
MRSASTTRVIGDHHRPLGNARRSSQRLLCHPSGADSTELQRIPWVAMLWQRCAHPLEVLAVPDDICGSDLGSSHLLHMIAHPSPPFAPSTTTKVKVGEDTSIGDRKSHRHRFCICLQLWRLLGRRWSKSSFSPLEKLFGNFHPHPSLGEGVVHGLTYPRGVAADNVRHPRDIHV